MLVVDVDAVVCVVDIEAVCGVDVDAVVCVVDIEAVVCGVECCFVVRSLSGTF